MGRVELELFGTSLRGFRFFVALAEGFVVPFAGLAARELGGEREAQFAAALAVAIQSPSLFGGSFMSYSSFDYLWWVPVGVLRNLLAQVGGSALVGCYRGAIGVGMMTKYTMAFSGLGCGGGLASDAESAIPEEPWLWCGVVAASLIMLPNIVWQMQHQFVSE